VALTGGCYCRAVRYEAGGEPFERALCHCTMCRGTTGAPAVAWFTVMRSDFRFTAGEPTPFSSSPQAERTFCQTCGTQLTFAHADYGDRIDITAASLDDPERAPPREHIWTRSRLSWMTGLDRLPEQTMADQP
jgi:hypothetical protein